MNLRDKSIRELQEEYWAISQELHKRNATAQYILSIKDNKEALEEAYEVLEIKLKRLDPVLDSYGDCAYRMREIKHLLEALNRKNNEQKD